MSTMIGSPYGGQPRWSRVEQTITGNLFMPGVHIAEIANGNREGQKFIPVRVSWLYDPNVDSLGITLAFNTGAKDPVTWLVARDLLIDGLTKFGGFENADAQAYSVGGNFLLELSAPSGNAKFYFKHSEVKAFLTRTMLSVPRGEEVTDEMLNAGIAELLKEND